MKITDLIDDFEEINDELIIFQEDKDDLNSDIILSHGEVGDGGIKKENGKEFFYLIEVFLAKEFINDWKSGLSYSPSKNEIAQRLYEYAINDA